MKWLWCVIKHMLMALFGQQHTSAPPSGTLITPKSVYFPRATDVYCCPHGQSTCVQYCLLAANHLLKIKYANMDFEDLWCFHTRARQRQDNDKTNVEPVHFYYAFHTRSDKPGVKGIIEMHRFNFCLVVVLSLSCSGVKAPLQYYKK